ncbi:MAG: OsmC family protein [Sedimentisphaerales bacterium]|nr:OsmC family protein [Sedimentisphaerales bacterium]
MKRRKSYLFRNTVFKEGDELAKTIFSGPGELEVGPAPEFEGSPETLNPEEMFVAAINGCIMTTFFYFVRKSDVKILSYHSNAEGQVEKGKDGFRFTNVQVRAKVMLSDHVFAEKVREFGNLAEKYCLVSHSLACPVRYHLEIG